MPLLSPQFALVIFIAAAAAAVAGQLLVLRDAATGRTPAAATTPRGRAREFLWIAIPAIALALVIVATWRALPRRDVPPATLSPAADTRTTSRSVALPSREA